MGMGSPQVKQVAWKPTVAAVVAPQDRAGLLQRVYNDPQFSSLPSCEFLIS
ncbi:hypothetical protein [Nostoc sp.]|uniref:hypothetical protein n=1 Tax=Nostoc sp. TaxID=1180 RepID=UPI002FFA94EA